MQDPVILAAMPPDCGKLVQELTAKIEAHADCIADIRLNLRRLQTMMQTNNNDLLMKIRDLDARTNTVPDARQIIDSQHAVIRVLRARVTELLQSGVVHISDEEAAKTIQSLEDKLEKADHHIDILEQELRALRAGVVPEYHIAFTPDGSNG